jgi:choline dehydrogenase
MPLQFNIRNTTVTPDHAIFIPDATPFSAGLMSAADKVKLDGLAPSPPTSYDYVVVGYGTAGCALVNLLTADGTKSVLVLESGQNYTGDPNVQQAYPVTSPNVLSYKYIFDYRASFATPSANPPGPNTLPGTMGDDQAPRALDYWAGRMWGGGSSHNYIQMVRGSADVYDGPWQAAGGSQWSYANLLDEMKWMENYTASFDNPAGPFVFDPAQRNGTSPPAFPQVGPLFVTQNPFFNLQSGTPFVQNWLAEFGGGLPAYTLAGDYNVPTNDVCLSAGQSFITNEFDPTTRKRSSSATAFAPNTVVTPAGVGVGVRKLTVLSGAQVIKVNLTYTSTGVKATGLNYYLSNDASKVVTVNASTKVILCAGAVEDPCILQRSGIGPSALLNDLGIEVFVDNANVGANMQNHSGGLAYLYMPFVVTTAPIANGDVTITVSDTVGLNPAGGTVLIIDPSAPPGPPSFLSFTYTGFAALVLNLAAPVAGLAAPLPPGTLINLFPLVPPSSFSDAQPVNATFTTPAAGPFTPDGVRRVQIIAIAGDTLQNQITSGYITASSLYALGLTQAAIATQPVTSVLSFGLKPPPNGNVTITSSDPTFLPQINMNVYPPNANNIAGGTPEQIVLFQDMKNTLLQIIRFSVAWSGQLPILPNAAIIPAAWTLSDGVTPLSAYGASAVNEDAINQYIYDYSFVLAHICSTCRMSPTAATGVVDGNLDVHGVEGLAIASNAVTPEIISGNTSYSAFLIGLKKAVLEGAAQPW